MLPDKWSRSCRTKGPFKVLNFTKITGLQVVQDFFINCTLLLLLDTVYTSEEAEAGSVVSLAVLSGLAGTLP